MSQSPRRVVNILLGVRAAAFMGRETPQEQILIEEALQNYAHGRDESMLACFERAGVTESDRKEILGYALIEEENVNLRP